MSYYRNRYSEQLVTDLDAFNIVTFQVPTRSNERMAKKKLSDAPFDVEADTEAFVVDFSDIKDFEPVPAGNYDAEIVKADPGMSKSQNPKITLQWRILAGEMENRRVFHDLSFHPKALFATKRTLVGLGFDRDFKGNIDPEELVGLTANINVAVETSEQINPNTNEPYPPRNVVKNVSASDLSMTDLI